MGKNQLRLLRFAMQFPGWHSYGRDRNTVAALSALEYYGLIVIDKKERLFRLADRKIAPLGQSNDVVYLT